MRRIVSCVGICNIEAIEKLLHAVLATGYGYLAYHRAMSRIRPEYLDPHPSDPSVASDVLVREEPNEEDEENDENDENEEDDNNEEDGDEGYSE
jgi:hypothetical protein